MDVDLKRERGFCQLNNPNLKKVNKKTTAKLAVVPQSKN
ncbi:hypothetical protein SAMN03097699_0977 [Flavobacteriaceae bacterium MAR_2010_188]|nr:hypothetical protein SAMN03097699_0977 [Flavobacteriaceae bacterium MAR_2010_188]